MIANILVADLIINIEWEIWIIRHLGLCQAIVACAICLVMFPSCTSVYNTMMRVIGWLLWYCTWVPTGSYGSSIVVAFNKIRCDILSMLSLIDAGDCYFPDDPLSYTGIMAVDKMGGVCRNWSDTFVINYLIKRTSNAVFPEANIVEAANYCRNPTNLMAPWCFSIIATGGNYCTIPECPPKSISHGTYSDQSKLASWHF